MIVSRRGRVQSRPAGLAAVMALGAVLVAGTAAAQAPPPVAEVPSETTLVFAPLLIGSVTFAAEWHVPALPPLGLAVMAHGFTRQCANLRGTLAAISTQSITVLCVDAPMERGNPALANALADALAAGLPGPDGAPLPDRVVVGGHSAGALFALHLGARLVQRAPGRLRGAVLLDPVAAGRGFTELLRTVAGGGERPVRAIAAREAPCNAGGNALAPLKALAAEQRAAGHDGFVGVQLLERSTHADAEGDDTDWVAVLACGSGRPQAGNVALLRQLAAQWAADALRGARTPAAYPGGAVVDAALAAGTARPIE